MEDNELREEEKKSLLKEMAKKGISKKIKAMPLKTKLIIIGSIFGVVFFLLLFIVLITPLTMLLDNIITYEDPEVAYLTATAESNYWWPIGGSEIVLKDVDGVEREFAPGPPTTTNITSLFDPNRVVYDKNGNPKISPHYAIDISWSGTQNIIAAASGLVIYVNNNCDNNGYINNFCGNGLGNYVIVSHSDGNFTTYGHMKPGTIRVIENTIVKQGQILGEMGNSGNSSGQHLHFQLEVGGRGASIYGVNPLDYIYPENPRPESSNTQTGTPDSNVSFIDMLHSLEGTGPATGEYYKVYKDEYNALAIGHGVRLEYNKDEFSLMGTNVDFLEEESLIEKTIVDAIEEQSLERYREIVTSTLQENNITLEEHQIDALVIRMYDTNNIVDFVKYYNQYGNTIELYNNYMSKPNTDINNKVSTEIDKRRQAEWNLFHEGTYALY